MLRTRDPSFGAFIYEEKCYRCGYKFTLNVSFDKKGIRNFCILEGEKFQMGSILVGIFDGKAAALVDPVDT